MTTFLQSKIVAFIATLGLSSAGVLNPGAQAIAVVFGQKDVDPSKLEVLASPYGNGSYQLLILEQLSDKRPCWSESGSNPTIVDPLLLQFDFTGICGRSTDSNGYSLRMGGRDFGLVYDLNVVRRENDLVLTATNLTDRKAPVIEIGRTNGIPPAGQFAKIYLDQGWRLTKRTSGDRELGHVYLTSDTVPQGVTLSAFADTQSHWARAYIDVLAARGIISGFSEDNSFRPDDPVTRVQFAAIINKAFPSVPAVRSGTQFKDVPSNFWGAEAIQTAYQKGFMSGYPDNTFKPNQSIPRLEALVSLASGFKLGSGNTAVLTFYQDASQIPDWASGAIAAVTERRMVVDYPRVNELNPGRTATRAEVAAFVYQALVDAGQLPVIPSPYVVVINPEAPTSPVAPRLNPSANPPVAPTSPPTEPAPTPNPAPTSPPSVQPPAPAPSPVPTSPPSVQPPAPTQGEPLTPPAPSPTPTPTPQPSPTTPPNSTSPTTPPSGSVVVPTAPQ
jgi:hypothetical protein